MRSQIAREASYLENEFVKNQKQMGLIFGRVYQPRQYGCIHIIHTFYNKKTLQGKIRIKITLGVITRDEYRRR